MKLTAILLVALTALACDVQAKAQDATKSDSPKPGEQVVQTVELPLALGGEWTGGDAMPLGGDNPLDETKTEILKYWLFIPTDESAKSDKGFPLLLFLHGAGERGDDPEAVKMHGPPKFCADPEKAKTWKFLTVSPQVKGNRFWSPAQLRLLVEKICAEQPVDKSRVYVTGLSMGGFGTWGFVANSPDLIAAAAPICGGYRLEFAPKMTDTPIWAFHGTADGAVKFEYSRNLVEKLRELGAKEIIFTIYPGANHNVWTRTYDNPKLYDWFLEHKLEK
ncbi:MAG: prolyl oligopeptidase family serine peptidase [Thermoguttaceae bacterium]|nr:prolyl oligopeptidase family serine peptidase [Thermoguttaceae bacterium]